MATASARVAMTEPAAAIRPALISRLLNLTSRMPRAQRLGMRVHSFVYRRTRGRWAGRWINGAPVLLLETTGRRSGKRRTAPVIFARTESGFVVTAANAGAASTPAWWLNLRASGRATVEVAGGRFSVEAREAYAEERERLWSRLREAAPGVDDYRQFTDRRFPVVELEVVEDD